MSQPAPKGQFTQILLFAGMLTLGIMLFTQKPAPDPRTSDQILEEVRSHNARILDVSIVGVKSKLDAKVDEEAGKKLLTPEQALAKKIEGSVLVANAQFKAGIQRNEFNRINNAFMTLQDLDRKHAADKVWTEQTFEVPKHAQFPENRFTADQLYGKIVDELGSRSKRDLVWGMVPGYQLIDMLVAATGRVPGFSYWFAGLLLAFVVRAVVFPLAAKQYMFGRMMGQLSPLAAEIKAQYTDKKTGQITNMQEYQQKSMEMYREYGFNPFNGCWPALVQVPFFLLIYNCMLYYRFEFQKGTFLWINPATSQATGGFIAPNLGERDYILIVVYAISMIVTSLMAPTTATDPAQAKQAKWMGVAMAVVFSVIMFFWPLPSAFVLYWVFTNVFATAHMLYAYRQPLPPLQKVNAPNGGMFPGMRMPDAKSATGTNGSTAKVRTGTPVKHRPKKKK